MQKRVLALTIAVLALSTLLLAPAVGQGRPLKIAMLSSLSGPFTFWGINVRDGMKMAVEEVNAAGGVLGRPMEFVERDDRNSPAEAITAYRALVEREGVAGVAGVLGSDVGLALARESDQLRVPVFLNRAGAHTILQKGTRYTFRTCLVSSPMYVQASAELVKYAKYKRIGAVVADYGWGHSYREWLGRYTASMPGMQVQIEVAPVPASDFTPYLRRLQGINPEFLDIGGHPPGNPVLVRQAAELGMTQQMFGAANPPELVMQRAGDAAFGRYVDYTCADFTHPTFRRLAAQFYTTYKRYFDDNAFSGYVTVKMMADAAKKANTADPRKIADVIRGGRFAQPGYGWPLSYTEWGEMKEARPFLFSLLRSEAPGGICPGCGWAQRLELRTPRLEPYTPDQ